MDMNSFDTVNGTGWPMAPSCAGTVVEWEWYGGRAAQVPPRQVVPYNS